MRYNLFLRSAVVLLSGLLFWSASLLHVGRVAQGAGEARPVLTACHSRLDEVLWQTEQSQMRRNRPEYLRALEAGRQRTATEHRQQVRSSQAAAKRQAAAWQVDDLVPAEYVDLVLAVADTYELDPRLLAAVGTVESQWYAQALGAHGDSGLMQILPSTAEWIARRMGLNGYDLYDPVTNMNMGAWYLATLYQEYGDWSMALAGYNGGPRGAPRGAEHPYTRRVMSVYRQQGTTR